MAGVIVALDFNDLDRAVKMAEELRPHVAGFKVGHGLLFGDAPHAVERVAAIGLPVFVDAKLHDIPATVEAGARQLGLRGARWVTVHAIGGSSMLAAAVAGLDGGSQGSAGVLAVSVLTSLDDDDLAAVGIPRSATDQVALLAGVAADAGVEGLVCAVAEVPTAKLAAPELTMFTPGIRPSASDHDDQRRVSTVEAAVAAGADYLVVGRPITRADDPVAAALSIGGIAAMSGMNGTG